MEKDRSSKIIAIVALAVAVLGVSIGFAAFSKDLVIQPTAEVKGDSSKFDVQFSTSDSVASSGSVTATLNPTEGGFLTATPADLTSTTVNNLKATFTNGKGKQTATYKFYVYNNGELDAYLKKVTFGKLSPECTAKEGTSQDLVTTACQDVSMKITVGGKEYSSTNESIVSEVLNTEQAKDVAVVLEYIDSNPVDGDFDVDFGSITLNYSSSDGE